MSKFFRQITNLRLLTITSLSLSIFFTPIAIAGFAPTNRKPASDYSRTAGKRGCPSESSEAISLTLLAPQIYVGYTASLRPTFVGFISNPQKIEFRIFEFISDNRVKQIGEAIIEDVKSGIFQISLPEKYPDLIVGKKYLWQLTNSCSGVNIVEAAEFIVAEIPSTLRSELSTAENSLQKANIYAKENLWYEALTEALKSANDGKLGKLGSSLVQNLAEYESSSLKNQEVLVKKRIQYLQTIAIKEQQ